jgi:hypothetical protein
MLEGLVELFAMHRYDPERPHGVLFCAYLCFVLLTRKTGCFELHMGHDWRVTCQPMAWLHFLATGPCNHNGRSKQNITIFQI